MGSTEEPRDAGREHPSAAAGQADAEATKRQVARQIADEFLGRGAAIARASIRPLGVAGRVALTAGVVVWVAGFAPLWGNRPNLVFSAVSLGLLVLPGVRLLRHRARMQEVLENLPALLDNVSGALAATRDLGSVRDGWRRSGVAARSGLFRTGRRWFAFYRNDIAPLRSGPGKVVGQVTGLLEAFSAPALLLSGIAVVLGVVLVVLAPVALAIRLLVLVS